MPLLAAHARGDKLWKVPPATNAIKSCEPCPSMKHGNVLPTKLIDVPQILCATLQSNALSRTTADRRVAVGLVRDLLASIPDFLLLVHRFAESQPVRRLASTSVQIKTWSRMPPVGQTCNIDAWHGAMRWTFTPQSRTRFQGTERPYLLDETRNVACRSLSSSLRYGFLQLGHLQQVLVAFKAVVRQTRYLHVNYVFQQTVRVSLPATRGTNEAEVKNRAQRMTACVACGT